jgi:serine/threonine-protein kinase
MNTTGDTVMGTPFYMSPEQAKADRNLDHRTDVYALGGVLYHMLVGSPPFRSNTMAGMITAHLNETPKRPSQSVIGLPSGLDDIVSRCLEKSPAARFQTMLELAAECDAMLMRLAGGEPFGHTVPIGPPRATTESATTLASAAGVHEIIASPARKRRRWAIVASALLVAGAATAGLLIFGGGPTKKAGAPRAAAGHLEMPAAAAAALPAPAPALAPAPPAPPAPAAAPAPDPAPAPVPAVATGSAASQPVSAVAKSTKTTPLRKKTKAVTQRKHTTTTKQAEDLYDDR